MFAHAARSRRPFKRPPIGNRLLRGERLEPRTLLSGHAVASLVAGKVSVAKPSSTAPVLTSISIRTANGQTVSPGTTFTLAGASQSFVVQGLDQSGKALSGPTTFSWSTASVPSGAAAPKLTPGGNTEGVVFSAAGSYGLTVQVSAGGVSLSGKLSIAVSQVLSSIVVGPNVATVNQGASQQFTAQGLDQFKKAMTAPSAFTWSAGGGTITSGGNYTASSPGKYTVTAKSGTLAGTATVTVQASSGWNSAAFENLVQTLDAGGSINRQDMIQVLDFAAAAGPVTAGELANLKTFLAKAAALNVPGYVQVLAGDVIDGNAANTDYQGAAVGNLAVGSSAAEFTKLIDKWFLGTDHPALCNSSLTYRPTAGSLFPHTPSHSDEVQGALGDCYLISALGTLADSNPAAIQNAIINNGDGTYTVRFYYGPLGVINNGSGTISAGFTTGTGTADYVTVDGMLPASSSGILQYADYGASCSNSANALWIPLIEKAYAQWNETGKEGRDGTNAYASIQGGWMATVDAQVLGHNASDYIMSSTLPQVAVNALAARQAVTIGTQNWSGTNLGLYADHAYAIIGYNAGSQTFTLYNPWGTDQPGPLTWPQLQATCTQLCTCSTSGSTPFVGAAGAGSAVAGIAPDTRHAMAVELALARGAFGVR